MAVNKHGKVFVFVSPSTTSGKPEVGVVKTDVKMPDRCVVFGCKNSNSKEFRERGLSLHRIPFFEDQRPIAKKRRKLWVDFVNVKRQKWEPSKYSSVCSQHFTEGDFERPTILQLPEFQPPRRDLKRDEVGISVFPSIQPNYGAGEGVESQADSKYSRPRPKKITHTTREHRIVSILIIYFLSTKQFLIK